MSDKEKSEKKVANSSKSAADNKETKELKVTSKKPIPVEAIVRGYLIGSGWKDYQMNQSVCGINLPQGLKLAEQLLEPIFTPSNKAKVGDKDENISIKECESLIGKNVTEQIAKEALYKASAKLPIKTKFIKRVG